MNYVAWFTVLLSTLALPAALHAATVLVDGNPCGNLSSLQVNENGNVTIVTSNSGADECKIAATVPTDPPPAGTFALSVTAPTGGKITSGAVINCPGDCTENVTEGAPVTLTATPTGTGYSAGTWGGDCAGSTADPCNLTMTKGMNVSATFTYTAPTNPDCPANTTCIARNWPITAGETFSLTGSQALSIKVNTTAAGVGGKLTTSYVNGPSAMREVALSSAPGDFNISGACLRPPANPSTVNYWYQGTPTPKTYQCALPVNGVAYINIRHTDCGGASTCTFYLSNY